MKNRGFHPPVLRHLRLSLPDTRRRWRVVHLTDLHFGVVTPVGLQRAAVSLANAQQPDLVVLTGDFLCRGTGYLSRMQRVLAGLQGPVVAVLGNHDHYCSAAGVTQHLEAAGIQVLRNEWTEIAGLPVVGVDDPVTGNDDPRAATARLPRAALGLCHAPDAAPRLWARGVPLVLSGHTHGGQLDLRVVRAMHRAAGTRFLQGVHHHPTGSVYVNPGVGSSVLPWRLGEACRRTVAVIDVEGDGSSSR